MEESITLEEDLAFFNAISRFPTCDFQESTNEECIMLKHLMELASTSEESSLVVESLRNSTTGLFSWNNGWTNNHRQVVSYSDSRKRLAQEEESYEANMRPIEEEEDRSFKYLKLSEDFDRFESSEDETDKDPDFQSTSDGQDTTDDEDPNLPSFIANGSFNPNSFGEARLRIQFHTFGRIGKVPQHYGKSGAFIPDGLCGEHEMYDQQWRFDVNHLKEKGRIVIHWKITNLTSNLVVEMKETPKQAALRETSGRTLCNKIVKIALTKRAEELQHTLDEAKRKLGPKSDSQMSKLQSSINVLQPKLCTVGLLFFGLLHESVQTRMVKRMD